MGDGRVEGSSAIGDGGQTAVSFMTHVDGMHIPIFESSHLEGSYVGNLLYSLRRHVNYRFLLSLMQFASYAKG